MRVFFVALVCSGALLGQVALAQTDNTMAAPSATAQPIAPVTTVAPSQTATAAAATAPGAVPQQTEANVNLDEIVCKNSPATTGTRLGGGRECHSVREWNQREKQAQDITRQQQVMGLNSQGK